MNGKLRGPRTRLRNMVKWALIYQWLLEALQLPLDPYGPNLVWI